MIYNKKNLEITKITDKKSVRPAMAGVYFTPSATVATDSYRLIEVSTPKFDVDEYPSNVGVVKEFEPFLVSSESVEKVKINKNKVDLPILDNVVISKISDDTVDIATTDIDTIDTKTLRKVHELYPEYAKIKPQGEPVTTINISARYLKDICGLLEGYNKANTIEIEFHGENKPLVLKVENSLQSAYALVMPVKL